MEHLHHFQLSEDPFRCDPLEKFDAEIPSQEQALRRVDRAVRQGKGLVVLLGAVGAGKTHVARRLYEELEEEVFEAAMMVVLRRQTDADWLVVRFASQLGVEDPAPERDTLLGQIYERLAIIREDGRHAVLIVDDAQGLANADTLSEVCGLVKLEYEDRRLLTVVLVGSPLLDRALLSDPFLAHHVDAKIHLAALDRQEASDYMQHRVRCAGGDAQLLLPGAVAGLHELSEGLPGRLNVLADNALYEAYLNGRAQLAKSDVERAYRDLGWGELGGEAGTPVATPQAAAPRSARAGAAKAGTGEPDRAGSDPELSFSDATAGGQVEQTVVAAIPKDAELTVRDVAPAADLDMELEAVFEPTPGGAPPAGDAQPTLLMDFDANPAPVPPAPAARAAAAPTEIQLEPSDALNPPPKEGDEVDDLFMELLDD